MTDMVFLPITCCKECPRCIIHRDYNLPDSIFEKIYHWKCYLDPENRTIAIIAPCDSDPSIPDWCPLRK